MIKAVLCSTFAELRVAVLPDSCEICRNEKRLFVRKTFNLSAVNNRRPRIKYCRVFINVLMAEVSFYAFPFIKNQDIQE